jgi:FRG domain
MTQQVLIRDWNHFINFADRFLEAGPPTKTHYLFRGQSDASWSLTPSLHRDAKLSKLSARQLLEIEKVALKEFKAQAHLFLQPNMLKATSDVLGWWTIMQHHGAPTRLLDWTTSVYVAAYFACTQHLDKMGAIWVLHPYSLEQEMKTRYGFEGLPDSDKQTEEFFLEEDAPSVIVTFERGNKTDRMIAQQGVFSVCRKVSDFQHQILAAVLTENADMIRFIQLLLTWLQRAKVSRLERSW